MENEFIELTAQLEKFFTESTNTIELINAYESIEKDEYSFFNSYYKYELAKRIVQLNISFEINDFIVAFDYENKIRYYKYFGGVDYFEDANDLRKQLKKGFMIRGIEFLKSGFLPLKQYFGMSDYIQQENIIKIIRGAYPKNRAEEKKIFKLLQLNQNDLIEFKKNASPILIYV